MTSTEYDDAMARARATLAVLNRTAAELSRPGHDPDAAATALQHLRDHLHHHDPRTFRRPDAPSMAQPERR